MLFPGAGGYWWRLVHRDTVAAAFKRTATGDHPNVKFSNSPGKESLGGYLRVYGRDDTLVVADASEPPPGRAAVREAGGAGPHRVPRDRSRSRPPGPTAPGAATGGGSCRRRCRSIRSASGRCGREVAAAKERLGGAREEP